MTLGGDGLRDITAPFNAYLYEPTARQREDRYLLDPAQAGLDPAGKLYPVQVTMANLASGKTAGVMINPLPEIPSGIEGCWLCVNRAELGGPDDLYFFELREFEVVDAESGASLARIEDYMETAAHGILVTRTPEDVEVLLPIVDEYVTIDRKNKLIKVRGFDDFK